MTRVKYTLKSDSGGAGPGVVGGAARGAAAAGPAPRAQLPPQAVPQPARQELRHATQEVTDSNILLQRRR